MSTQRTPFITLFDSRNSLLRQVTRSLVSFGSLGLCIWLSKGSAWWSLFTCALFLLFAWVQASLIVQRHRTVFASLDELAAWVEQQRQAEQ